LLKTKKDLRKCRFDRQMELWHNNEWENNESVDKEIESIQILGVPQWEVIVCGNNARKEIQKS